MSIMTLMTRYMPASSMSTDVPAMTVEALGSFYSQRLDTMVLDIIRSSSIAGEIVMSRPIQGAMDDLMLFLKDRVYMHSEPKREEGKACRPAVPDFRLLHARRPAHGTLPARAPDDLRVG